MLDDCKFASAEEKETLVTNIKHRLTPHPVKIRAGEWDLKQYFNSLAPRPDFLCFVVSFIGENDPGTRLVATLLSGQPTLTQMYNSLAHSLTHSLTHWHSDVEVSCYAYEGIDAVKSALSAGLTQSTEAFPIKINLIAPPQYVITVTTLERTEGIAKLNTAIQIIRETIEEKDGQFNVKMEVMSCP